MTEKEPEKLSGAPDKPEFDLHALVIGVIMLAVCILLSLLLVSLGVLILRSI